MPWIPAPFRLKFPAWLVSSTGTEPYSFKPIAQEIGKDYVLAAVAAQTSFGSFPLSVGTALDIQEGFEKSFEKIQTHMDDVVTWAPGDSPTEWGMQVPDEVWLDAATAVVKYWGGGSMLPAPPAPGGSAGISNDILFPGYAINNQTGFISVEAQLTKDISAAFKLYNGPAMGTALDKAFVAHLKLVSGLWSGLAAAGTPPPPFAFPWVGLS